MPDPRDVSVHNLLEKIVFALVDHPNDVTIDAIWMEEGAVFRIRTLDAGDLGKIIGKQGRTIKSIRVLLAGFAVTIRRRFMLAIEEPPDSRRESRPPT